jgi:hypothetical protein
MLLRSPSSTVTRNMSVDTFNDVLDTAMAEENKDVDFSFMDNTVSGKASSCKT